MSKILNLFGEYEETTPPPRPKKTEPNPNYNKTKKINKRKQYDEPEPQQIKIKPNSLVIYTPRKKYSRREIFEHNDNCENIEDHIIFQQKNEHPYLKEERKQRRNITNGFLSDRAGNRLRTFIKFLLWSSGCFKIQGKRMDLRMTGRISFITLTLSSPQKHSDQVLKEKMLNQFITELKTKHLNLRYIWRAEKQENGNIHFHFLVNRFVHYEWCQGVWNRIQDKMGYIAPYQKKFSAMSFREYCEQKRNFSIDKIPIYQRQFKRGCVENWSNPPSIQAKGLGNTRKALYYISKYISKNDQRPEDMTADQRKKQSIAGHIWFCCYELMSLKCPTEFMTPGVIHDLDIIKSLDPNCIFYDTYCTIIKRPIEYLFNLGCYNIFNLFVPLFGVLQKNELFNST